MTHGNHTRNSVRYVAQRDECLTYLGGPWTAQSNIENIKELRDDHENHEEARDGPSG